MKYIVAKLSLVMLLNASACSQNEEAKTTSSEAINLINYSDLSNEDMTLWTDTMAAKMASRTANILAVSWNVGAQISEGGFDRPFNKHQVKLQQDDIDSILSQTSSWMGGSCANEQTKSEELANFRNYLENGADASAHLVICGIHRIILMGMPTSMTAEEKRHLVIHEFYHGFQQDLADESCVSRRDNSANSPWIVEGAAEYFTMIELFGSTEGVNQTLSKAYEAYNNDSNADITGTAIASRGAAGIRYLIESGALIESEILDGSFFHSCKSEDGYTDSNASIIEAKNNWFRISENNGQYQFDQ